MSKDKKIVTQIEIEALVNQAQKDLAEVGAAMETLWQHSKPPKQLSREYESLKLKLTSLQAIAKKGVIDSTDIAQAKSDYKSLKKDIHNLTIEYELLTEEQKKGLLSPEERKSFEDRRKAIQEYNKALEKNIELETKKNAIKGEKENRENRSSALTSTLDRVKQKRAEMVAPEMSADVKDYVENLEKINEIQNKIKATQKTLGDLETKGKKGKADYRRADETLKTLEKELALRKKNEGVGKVSYDKYAQDLENYNAKIKIWDEKIAAAEGKVTALKNEIANFNKELTKLDVKDQAKMFEELKAQLVAMGVKGAESAKDLKELEEAVGKLEGKALKRAEKEITKVTNGLKKMGKNADEIHEDLDQAADDIKRQADEAARTKEFEQRIKNFLGLAGAAQVLRSALRNALSTITELDKTMTEMAVVTDLTVGDYWEQLPEYSKRASELGVSINSAYKAATLYYQQGLKTNEVNAISTETLKMARIAGLSAEDATNKMTAALRGFNMELNETSAHKISDVYSELAAITAADVDEISSAMTKTASIASSAGMEFETTAAFLSQIIETTRESAETAGTAMKTVIARFQELKKAPEEIGEVDGEIVDANKIETALRSVGVALRDASGQFRDLDDVFLELSSKWDTLDTNTQRYIATIAAGSRQQSRFIAMMSDYGRTQELVTAANNSAGASNKQFEKTMDSLESKVEELKNAWQEFSMGILNSDLVKTGVEILTKFLNIINKMTGALDGVWDSAMKLISVISLFKLGQKIFDKFKNPLIKMFADIVPIAYEGGINAGKAFSEGVKEAKEELEEKKPENKDAENKKEQEKEKTKDERTVKQKAFDTIGVTGISEGWGKVNYAKTLKANQKKAQKNAEEKQATFEKIQSGEIRDDKGRKIGKNRTIYKEAEKEAQQAKKDLEDAENAVASYDKTSEEAQKRAAEGWEQMGQGVQKMGATVSAVGIGVSAFGGILSSLGLEEVGEGFTQVGNVLTLVGAGISAVGTALTAIPPLLTLISSHPIIAIIVAVLAVILASIVAIVTAIKNASPEAKLKKAQEAAENAAEAADAAAEAYDRLAESLDSLDGKYKALEELTRGTKEWNEAVRGINSSVLDLISEYPELAKFVENREGVLTIDVESTQVQDVLNDAEMRKITSKNNAIMANIEVAKAQSAVDYKNLSDDAKFGLGRANAAYGAAMYGTMKAGAGAGAGVGAVVGNAIPVPGVGAAIGAAVGGVVGAIGGVIGGLFTGQAAKDAVLEQTRKDTNDLAKMLASGEIIVKDGTYKAGSKTLDELGYTQEQLNAFYNEVGDATDELMKYGESSVGIDLQQQAAYDAIASSAQQLADTLEMTEEQIRQSAVLVDGELSGQFYKEAKDDLDKKYGKMNDKNFAKDAEVQAAIKKQYGETARIDKNGKVTYRKGDEDVEVTVTKEEVLGWMATQTATEKATTAIEFSDEAIAKVGAAVGSEAIGNLYDQSEGRGLTKADVATLQDALSEGTLQEVWKNMTYNERLAYGDDINNLIKDLKEGTDFATKAFKKAGDAARDFMTADMAQGFKEKLNEVASMAGGENAYKTVQDATDKLLGAVVDEAGNIVRDSAGNVIYKKEDEPGALTNDQRGAIQSRINMTDWSNLEELLALQLDLELQYGYTTEEAKAYVDELGQAAFATSGLTTVVQKFGEVYQATQRVNQSLQRLSDLQWEYNRALKDGGDIQSLTKNMLAEYQKQADDYEEAYNAGLDDLAKTYASGAVDYGVDLRKFVKLGENGVQFDKEAFRMDEAVAAGDVSEADAQKFIDELTKQYETNQSNLDGLRKTLDNIEELEEEQKQSYDEIRDLAEETITDYLQKQIDLQQESLDAEVAANDKLINKLQEQIDEDRRREQEEKAKESIADLQQQYAYLSRDTSGANSLQMLDLESQIEQAEEDYTDSLIDTMLSDMQNANQKAEEQRQEQIDISRSQLQAYTESAAFQYSVDTAVKDMLDGTNPKLEELITSSMTSGMTSEKASEWATQFKTEIGSAKSWLDTNWEDRTGTLKDKITDITDAIGELSGQITKKAGEYAVEDKKQKLEGVGFSRAKLENATDEQLEAYMNFIGREANTENFAERYKTLYHANNAVLSRSQFYQKQMEDVKDPSKWWTYDQYLNWEKEHNSKNLIEQMVSAFSSDFLGYQNRDSNDSYNQALAAYESFGGSKAEFDEAIRNQMMDKNPSLDNGIKIYRQTGTIEGFGTNEWLDVLNSANSGAWSSAKAVLDGETVKVRIQPITTTEKGNDKLFEIGQKAASNGVTVGTLFKYEDNPYLLLAKWQCQSNKTLNSRWEEIPHSQNVNTDYLALSVLEDNKLSKHNTFSRFKTGGLADFTGPAWLDGTKSHPELVLNARDTENFIQLKDILAEIMSNSVVNNSSTNNTSGDNYYDIDISVDSLGNDYDVEQLADKIRNMIYEDSIYRNVNVINHIR